MWLHFGLYYLIILITEWLTKCVICKFSAAFKDLNSCEPLIKIGWFCPEVIACVRYIEKPDDIKEYIEGALKNSFGAKHTFILTPYIEKYVLFLKLNLFFDFYLSSHVLWLISYDEYRIRLRFICSMYWTLKVICHMTNIVYVFNSLHKGQSLPHNTRLKSLLNA